MKNIASPQSLQNVNQNENVCISFIDILVQKEYQLKGKARIVKQREKEFVAMAKVLLEMTRGAFPFTTIIEISINQAKIGAPRYMLYPEPTETAQIESALKTYGF